MAYRPTYTDEPDFGAELIGVAALCVLGIMFLGAFALTPLGTIGASIVGALIVWERGTRPSARRYDTRLFTVRNISLGLAVLATVVLLFRA